MPRKAAELGPLAVSRLHRAGTHRVGGVAGLCLQVSSTGARSWVLRATVGSRRREMGLGGYPDVTLAQAKEAARSARAKIIDGVDPISIAQAARAALKRQTAPGLTFMQAAEGYISSHEAAWKSVKHKDQWRSTLERYAYPEIGSRDVDSIEVAQIVQILQPIWSTKTETASRLRSRLELVLDWAIVQGARSGDNPARWRGRLDKLLPAPSRVRKVAHHKALSVDALPDFFSALRQVGGVGARALEFAILTAARSGEVRGATWREIDLGQSIWTVPGDRMKAGREHRVPLSGAATALLLALGPRSPDSYLFVGPEGGPLSDMTLSAVTRRMGVAAVPHGFRSTFRDWAAERTDWPGEVAEMALAHTVGNKVEAAYRRGDLLEKRVAMMQAWARHCVSSG